MPTSAVGDRHTLTVLIADGSLTARVHLRNTLANRGFTQVTDVSDSVKAVDALATLTRIDGQGLIEHVRQSPTRARQCCW